MTALEPKLQRQWDHAANQHMGSIVISRFSSKKAWWNCSRCPDGHPHQWLASVLDRSRGGGCPQCSGKKVCRHSSLATKFPKVARYWDIVKNRSTADEVSAFSNQKAHSMCSACTHEWNASPFSMVYRKNVCLVCSPQSNHRYSHPTFAECQPHMLLEWDHELNAAAGLFPSNVTLGSSRKVHWLCSRCPAGQKHSWTAPPACRTQRQTGCPFCAGQAACKCNSLQTRYPAVAAEWHPTLNRKTPDEYVGSSRQRVWWQNALRGTWQQRIHTRVDTFKKRQAAGTGHYWSGTC